MCAPPRLSEVFPVKLLKQFHFQHVGECGLFFFGALQMDIALQHIVALIDDGPFSPVSVYIVDRFLFLRPFLVSGRFCDVLGLYPQAVSQAPRHLDHLGH